MRRGLIFGRSVMSVMKTCTFTMLRPGTGCLQALVHHSDGDVELSNHVGRDAAVLRLANDASDPDVRASTGDVAIMADWPWDIGNDDALDFWHA